MTGDLFPEVRPVADEKPDDRYTTPATLEWCLRAMGLKRFDLDVAACKEAHCAEAYFSIEPGTPSDRCDGLRQRWSGNAWANIPFSDIEPWVVKAWEEFRASRSSLQSVAMLMPSDRTEQQFWQKHIEPFRDGHAAAVCASSRLMRRDWARVVEQFPYLAAVSADDWRFDYPQLVELETYLVPGRQSFGCPGNPRGVGAGSPPFPCVLLAWRRCE